MENKKMSKEELSRVVEKLVDAAKFACVMVEMDAPGRKYDLLDALLEELKKLDHRATCCGMSKGDAACENAIGKAATNKAGPLLSCMNFGMALAYLKDGYKVARKGWNGKGQYVELVECVSYRNLAGRIVNADHKNIGNKALAFVGTSGVQLGWLASQADMLAEDWYVVE